MTDRNPAHDRVRLSRAEVIALIGIEQADADQPPGRLPRLRGLSTEVARHWCRLAGRASRASARGWGLVALALGVATVTVAPPVVGVVIAASLLVVGVDKAMEHRLSRPPSSWPDRMRPRRRSARSCVASDGPRRPHADDHSRPARRRA